MFDSAAVIAMMSDAAKSGAGTRKHEARVISSTTLS